MPGHLIFVAIPLWGHTRPLCVLAARLQKQSQCLVTFLCPELILSKVKAEIERQYAPEEKQQFLDSVRVISILDSNRDNGNLPKVIHAYTTTFLEPYKAIIAGESITCTTGETYAPSPFPNAIIMDYLAPVQLQHTRDVTGHKVPVFAWVTGCAPVMIRYYCPENVGGLGDLAGRARKKSIETGEDYEKLMIQEYSRAVGDIVHIPGMAPMYDHEFYPQDLPFSEPLFNTMGGKLFQTLNDMDGTIINSSEAHESVFIQTLRTWLEGFNKDFFSVGPTMPLGYGESQALDKSPEQNDIEEFLNHAEEKYGKQSVFFISFGSTFWPKDEGFVEEILNVFGVKDIPYIFAYGSPVAKLPNFKTSEKAFFAKWVPQQYILNHPAVGWFLSHCGQGSSTEALSSGIPMICYPFASDQPLTASYFSLTLDVAFELLQVRTGDLGTKPMLRTGKAPLSTREAVREEISHVLDEARGDVGKRKRANAKRVQKLLVGAFEEGGLARREMDRFVSTYCV